jgi:hypothetical protein
MSGALQEKAGKTARKSKPPRLDVPDPPRWESESIVKQVLDILDSLELPPVKPEVRQIFQRFLYRQDKFLGGGGAGKIILICRCICESVGNEEALHDPIIVGGVASSLEARFVDRGLALIEAFDKIPLAAILKTMRALDLFSESSLNFYFGTVIRNKLRKILEPPAAIAIPKPCTALKTGRRRRPADQPARMAA